jgi:hypothetical protein
MLLEGTDAKVHFIYHTPEVAAAWRNGALRPNAFVRFRRMFGSDGRSFVEVAGLGDAEQLLNNKTHFRTLVRTASQQPAPRQAEPNWSGWLGKYHAAIANAQGTIATRQFDPRKGRGR